MSERFVVTAGGLTFDGVAEGPIDGRLVLFLHGFPQSSHEWRSQLGALGAAGYRAVAFDQRGYSPGARPPDVADYGAERLVADVLAVADDMGGHRFDLVGHDWGAAVAWHVAARYPERVRSLCAVSVPHPRAFAAAMADRASGQYEMSGYMREFRAGAEPSVEELFARFEYGGDAAPYRELLSQPGALDAAVNWYRAMSREDSEGCGAVEVPTLFVWSDGDVAVSRAAAEACAEWVSGPYRFEVLEGVSHWVPEQAADRLNALLLDNLAPSS